jgi:hypothetical protein
MRGHFAFFGLCFLAACQAGPGHDSTSSVPPPAKDWISVRQIYELPANSIGSRVVIRGALGAKIKGTHYFEFFALKDRPPGDCIYDPLGGSLFVNEKFGPSLKKYINKEVVVEGVLSIGIFQESGEGYVIDHEDVYIMTDDIRILSNGDAECRIEDRAITVKRPHLPIY